MSFRATLLVAIAVFYLAFGSLHGQQPAANTAPAAEAAAQEVTVADSQASVLSTEEEWSPLPDYLRGATVLRPSKGNELVLTANQPVQLIMAASWNYDGNASGGWFEGRTTLP